MKNYRKDQVVRIELHLNGAVGSRMLEGAARIVLNQLFEQLGKTASARVRGGVETGNPAERIAAAPAPKRSLWQRLLALFGVKS